MIKKSKKGSLPKRSLETYFGLRGKQIRIHFNVKLLTTVCLSISILYAPIMYFKIPQMIMKLFHQIVPTINQLLFLVISQPSQVQSEICFILDFSRLLALAGAGSGQQGLDLVPSGRPQPSARIKSLLYEILPGANNSGCLYCISQSVREVTEGGRGQRGIRVTLGPGQTRHSLI